MKSRLSFVELVQAAGNVTPERLDEAQERQVMGGGGIDLVLMEMGLLDEPTALALLSASANLPWVDRSHVDRAEAAAVALFPKPLAEKHRILPLALKGKTLAVAVSEVPDLALFDTIGFTLNVYLRPFITTSARLEYGLFRAYGLPLDPRIDGWLGMSGEDPDDPEPLDDDVLAVSLLDALDVRESALLQTGGPPPADGPVDAASAPAPAADAVDGAHNAAAAEDDSTPHAQDIDDDTPSFEVAEESPQSEDTDGWEAVPPRAALAEQHGDDDLQPASSAASLLTSNDDMSREQRRQELLQALDDEQAQAKRDEDDRREKRVRWTVDDAIAELALAEHRDEMIDVLLRFAYRKLSCAAVFIVQRSPQLSFVGWDVIDETLTRADMKQVRIVGSANGDADAMHALDQLFDMQSPFLGPLKDGDPLLDVFGRRPRAALLMPVVVGDRLAAVLYGDRGADPIPPSGMAELHMVVPRLGKALRNLILRSRGKAPAPADEPVEVLAPVAKSDVAMPSIDVDLDDFDDWDDVVAAAAPPPSQEAELVASDAGQADSVETGPVDEGPIDEGPVDAAPSDIAPDADVVEDDAVDKDTDESPAAEADEPAVVAEGVEAKKGKRSRPPPLPKKKPEPQLPGVDDDIAEPKVDDDVADPGVDDEEDVVLDDVVVHDVLQEGAASAEVERDAPLDLAALSTSDDIGDDAEAVEAAAAADDDAEKNDEDDAGDEGDADRVLGIEDEEDLDLDGLSFDEPAPSTASMHAPLLLSTADVGDEDHEDDEGDAVEDVDEESAPTTDASDDDDATQADVDDGPTLEPPKEVPVPHDPSDPFALPPKAAAAAAKALADDDGSEAPKDDVEELVEAYSSSIPKPAVALTPGARSRESVLLATYKDWVSTETPEMDALLLELQLPGDKGRSAIGRVVGEGDDAMPALARYFPGVVRAHPFGQLDARPDVSEFSDALACLKRLGADRAAPILMAKMSDDDRLHRYTAIWALSELHVIAALPRLAERVFDPEWRIALLAIDVLQHYDDLPVFERVMAELRKHCTKGDEVQRKRAIVAVAELKDIKALSLLTDLLGTRPKEISEEARRALVEITKQDFGSSSRRWRAWLADNENRPRVAWLVEGLAHKDAAIRASAQTELNRSTGKFFGYRADAPRQEREAALVKWRAWLTEQETA